jgi:hypothetical protein
MENQEAPKPAEPKKAPAVAAKPAPKPVEPKEEPRTEKPAKVENQVEHQRDVHTGPGTGFQSSRGMSVVPPSGKQIL